MRCGLACLYERRNVRKDLARWSRSTLLATGIENIVSYFIGEEVWESICPESSLCLNKSDLGLSDFVLDEQCLFCDRQRREVTADFIEKRVLMCDSDSGVCSSASPPTSPRASRSVPSASTDATVLGMSTLYERARDAIMRMQTAQQFEMMSQMQMLGLFGIGSNVTPEMHRIIFENQLAMANPFLAGTLWTLPTQPFQAQLQLLTPSYINEPAAAEACPREEQPLDLSRKSGLEAIIDIETANYSQKQKKLQQHQQPNFGGTEKEQTGSDELIRNGYGIKRNYSQVDLTAAVNDIRCGRLGTRRASVVYGIPRSTLRNKIYKLEAAEELTGQIPLSKRRRPGGQSNAEKKLAEQVERQKKATTPVTECSSISPSSDGTEEEKIENSESRWECDWTTNLWQSLFSQTAALTANITGPSSKEDMKKEELSEWKKSRPKRGQYRKYDKNALDEAVRSVRRGEMSVHRAGSYYGVPHSTLEYKVKERNLLRKKKDSPPAKEISPMQEPITSLDMSKKAASPAIVV